MTKYIKIGSALAVVVVGLATRTLGSDHAGEWAEVTEPVERVL